MAAKRDTKALMTSSAIALLQERGVNGVTVDAVLAASGAPRGSVYHHFPGGRAEIVHAAAQASSEHITEVIRRRLDDPFEDILGEIVEFWRHTLQRTDFRAGCPVAALITETSPELHRSVDLAAETFDVWLSLLQQILDAHGMGEDEARRHATLVLASLEGAVTLCRARRSIEPLDHVAETLADIVNA